MSEVINTTVCIVGGGPAGAVTSIMLAKMQVPHVVVDAAVFPRDKVCGDGLDLKVVRVLNNIDPNIVKNEFADIKNFTHSMGMRFILPHGKQVDLMCDAKSDDPLFQQPLFYTSRRTSFDEFLLNKIDHNFAQLLLNYKIQNITRQGETWVLSASSPIDTKEIRCKLLIGADGDHSIVVKNVLGKKIDRQHYAAAVRQYWKGVEGVHDKKLIEIYFPKQYPFAYFWMFPLSNDEVNAGFGMASHHVAKSKLNVRDALKDIIQNDPYISHRFKNARAMETAKGWGIPMSTAYRKPYGDGWLLTGDAASLVCPKSGEGIGPAMLSGYVAAHYIQQAVTKNCFEEKMFAGYDVEIHKRSLQEEKLYRFVNAMPSSMFVKGVDAVLGSELFKSWYTKKEMKRWLVTAYQKKLVIN